MNYLDFIGNTKAGSPRPSAPRSRDDEVGAFESLQLYGLSGIRVYINGHPDNLVVVLLKNLVF